MNRYRIRLSVHQPECTLKILVVHSLEQSQNKSQSSRLIALSRFVGLHILLSLLVFFR